VLDAPTVAGGGIPSYNLATSGFALDTISGAISLGLDSVGSDTVLVAAINAEALITAGLGGDNEIVFVTGQNVYDGTLDGGGDTVVAGSGQDTIYTSLAGSTSVFSGTGSAKIVLQDTTYSAASPSINDLVYLQDGINTVYASGTFDAVISTTESQTIYGYTSDSGTILANSTLVAVLQPNSDGSPSGDDLVVGAGSSTVYAYDFGSGNTVEGGAGKLVFVGGANVTASVESGTGTAYLFGASGDSITMSSATGDTGTGIFVAADGNESLNGAGFTNLLYLFGGSDSAGGSTVNDTLIGGSGASLLTAGEGNETLQGGTGTNYFQIGEGTSTGANILLTDFTANGVASTLILDGFTQADVQSIYNDTVTSGGNLVVTIGSSTTITFTGITSGSQLQGHIVSFSS
jgi:hypothetical protein